MKRFATLIMLLCFTIIAKAQGFDSTIISFDLDKSTIDQQEQAKLTALIDRIKNQPEKKILIYGYADYLGDNAYNKTLSTKRAEAIQKQITKKGIPQEQILVCAGLGKQNIKGNPEEEGNRLYRKVLILERKTKVTAPNKPTKEPEVTRTAKLATNLEQTPVLKTFVLQDIHFIRHTPQLTAESVPQLNALLEAMKNNPNLRIQLEGHICCNTEEGMVPGTFSYQLSINRALAIRNYLINNGIDKKRIYHTGFGRTKPLFEEETIEANAKANMRVEVRIINK